MVIPVIAAENHYIVRHFYRHTLIFYEISRNISAISSGDS